MAQIRVGYGASAAISNSIASLASSSGLTAGYESGVLDNQSDLFLDYLIAGRITTGTSPTAGVIEVWAIGALDDTPIWPDVFDGTPGAETITNRDILGAFGRLVVAIPTVTTSDQGYWFGPVSLASLFGGSVPKRIVFFTTHNTGVNLNSTGSNHLLTATGVYATSL
jgi:hypothetical protein